MDKKFEVQCGTVFETIFKPNPLMIIVSLGENNSVGASSIHEKDGAEFVNMAVGTTTAMVIEKLTGERWSLERLKEAMLKGIDVNFEGFAPASFLAWNRDRMTKSIEREYTKPPITLTCY